jgi:NAD(P)-dependent dehydrogenase (short-subunit alcohol dehydrogenase family)
MENRKHIIVTGCNGQLGRAICKRSTEHRISVHGIDLHETPDLVMESYTQGDVSSRETAVKAMNKLNLDNKEICLVNNAGIAVFSDPEERTEEDFTKVMLVNCFSVVCFITELIKWNRGRLNSNSLSVINIGSIYGAMSPDLGIYADTARVSSEVYGASKAAIIQITKYFAIKYAAEGCRVNAISPGGILNKDLQGPEFIKNYCNRVPMKRMCSDSEVAEAILEVGFSKSTALTGQNIFVDGGISSW